MGRWTRSIHRRRPAGWPAWLGAPALVIAVAVVWWWWPAFSGRGDGTDVLVVGNGDVAVAETPLARRLREQGLTVVVAEPPEAWCVAQGTITRAVEEVDPRVVVVGVRDVGRCGGDPVGGTLDVLVASGVDVVVVAQPGTADALVRAAAASRGLLVTDPARLLGEGDLPRSMRCEWWDHPCPASGVVEVRDVTGRLTAAGIDRLARVVAAEIR